MQDMNRHYIISLTALLLLTCGCTNRQEDEEVCPSDRRIGVSACLTAPIGNTRTAVSANPYMGTTPSMDNVLEASVWFSEESGTYANTGDAFTFPRHSRIQFNSSGTAYPYSDVLQYPESGTVYCVGLYPFSTSEWTNTDASGAASNTHASHAIDGTQDLMFAPEIEGTWANRFETLAFTHQLTWLKINVIAENSRAISAWGNITDITVTSPGNKLTVDLSTGTASCNSTPTDIKAFEGSTALKITSQQLGSVFCVPATSYDISVTTVNGGVKNLGSIALKEDDGTTLVPDAAYATGKMFVITLNFKPISTVDATCTLTTFDEIFRVLEGH